MNRPRVLLGLRIAFTAVCGLTAVLLCVLWVQGYSYPGGWGVFRNSAFTGFAPDELLNTPKNSWILGVGANCGNLTVGYGSDFWKTQALMEAGARPPKLVRGFACYPMPGGGWQVSIPNCLGVLIAVGIAGLPWLPWQFSLRNLLIATTLVAVVLGLALWAVGS
jgi:hypothetical protein